MTEWAKYDGLDTTLWRGMNKTLEHCDGNIEWHAQVSKGRMVYYAGIYQMFEVLEGERMRKHEKLLFLDLGNKKLHIFQDVNKVY